MRFLSIIIAAAAVLQVYGSTSPHGLSPSYGRDVRMEIFLQTLQNKENAVKCDNIPKTADTSINWQDANEYTALMLAVRNDNLDLVNCLLDKDGLDLNLKNMLGDTALIIAVKGRNKEIVEALIKRGADLKLKDKLGCTARDWAKSWKPDGIPAIYDPNDDSIEASCLLNPK